MKDASDAFNSIKGHSDSYAIDLMESLCVGKVENNDNE